MYADQYQEAALRTKSPISRPDLISREDFRVLLIDAITNGRTARSYKKALTGAFPYRQPGVAEDLSTTGLSTDLLHAVLGIINEAGELAEAIFNVIHRDGTQRPLDPVNLIEEGGDLQWFLTLLAHSQGVTLADLQARNIAKLKARYPDRFDASQLSDENRNKAAELTALSRNPPAQ